jgi:hypothetical protein
MTFSGGASQLLVLLALQALVVELRDNSSGAVLEQRQVSHLTLLRLLVDFDGLVPGLRVEGVQLFIMLFTALGLYSSCFSICRGATESKYGCSRCVVH